MRQERASSGGGRGAGGRAGEYVEPKVKEPRAHPFNPVEYDPVGISVVDTETEETERLAVAGGQMQPAVPYVDAAALKSILHEVQGKGDDKGGKGWREVPGRRTRSMEGLRTHWEGRR